jgi:hypothetical protein
MLSFPIEAHGYRAILQLPLGPREALDRLMSKMKTLTARPLSSYSDQWTTLPQKIVEIHATKKPATTLEGMVRATTGLVTRPLLRRHQFSNSRFKDLMITFVGLCNRLIVFVRRKPRDCRFTILELANQQDIADGQAGKLVLLFASHTIILF